MIKIIFCPEGNAFSEFVAEEYIANLVEIFKRNKFYPGEEKVFKFSTELPIDYLVYHVLSGNVPADSITFWDEENQMPCDMVCGLEVDPKIKWNFGKIVDVTTKILDAGLQNIRKSRTESSTTKG